jgi:hypothetical protein
MVSAPHFLTDRTGLVGGSAAVLVGLPEWIVGVYLTLRVLVPVGLITFAAWHASPRRRIALVRAYLLAGIPSRRPPKTHRPRDRASRCLGAQRSNSLSGN